MSDDVNHPKHYNSHPSGVECIDISEELTPNLAQAFQYVWRAGLKPAVETVRDLRAARWFLRREIKRAGPDAPFSVRLARRAYEENGKLKEVITRVLATEPDPVKTEAMRMITFSMNDRMNYYKPLAIDAVDKLLARFDSADQADARAEIKSYCQDKKIGRQQTADGLRYLSDHGHGSYTLQNDDPVFDLSELKAWRESDPRGMRRSQ